MFHQILDDKYEGKNAKEDSDELLQKIIRKKIDQCFQNIGLKTSSYHSNHSYT
jgi:hypothetical protein